jgi:hypothetical protein
MAAKPPSCSSFQASQPPTFQAFTLLLALLSVSALLCVPTLFAVLVLVVRFRRPLAARDAQGVPRSPSPRTSNAKSASAPHVRPVSFFFQRKARSAASFPLVLLFVFVVVLVVFVLLVLVFVPAAPADRSDAPLVAAPPRRTREGRVSNPPRSAPGAKPSVPRAFLFAAPKTILNRAGDDNLSKGLIDPFG